MSARFSALQVWLL